MASLLEDQKPLFEQNNSDFQKEAIWRKTSVFEQIEHWTSKLFVSFDKEETRKWYDSLFLYQLLGLLGIPTCWSSFHQFPSREMFSPFFSISENKLLKDKKDQLEKELRNEQTQQNSGDSYWLILQSIAQKLNCG